MNREKHGQYDKARHLPDNTGQAVGGGEKVWLMQEVAQHWPDLAAAAQARSGDRYSWLVKELRTMNDEQASAIADEYKRRLNAANRERAQRDRRRQLAQIEEQAKTATGARLAWIEKEAEKIRKQIAKAEQTAQEEE